jgi:hypothetical protein
MERAGIAGARVPRYYAKLDESAYVEDVDVADASVKRTRIDDSVMDPSTLMPKVSLYTPLRLSPQIVPRLK